MQPTEQQIIEWKEKYGRIFPFESEDGKTCWLRKADRKILSACRAKAGEDQIVFNELLLKNCWLAGDECFKDEDEYFFGIQNKLSELIVVKQVELKKL